MTVLAVDDSRTMRDMLRFTLSQAGMTTHLAEDGQHGLEVLEDAAPDVIITDINMPGIPPIEVLDGLARLQVKIPVVVISGLQDSAIRSRVLEIGASWVPKPFGIMQLERTVRRVLLQAYLRRSDGRADFVGLGKTVANGELPEGSSIH